MSHTSDIEFLRRAIALARRSLDSGGFPVGAILVHEGKEIACGLSVTETTNDVTAHGEVQAIRAAGSKAVTPLTLISSLEPCLMCLAASAWAGVTRIVYGCSRRAVNSAYYVNRGDVTECAQLLCVPPQLQLFPEFEPEMAALVHEYEKRHPIGDPLR